MADPDLQISLGVGELGGGGGGDSNPDSEIRGGPGLPTFPFRPFGPQFGLKIKEGPRPHRLIHWICNFTTQEMFAEVLRTVFRSFQKYSSQPLDRQCGKALNCKRMEKSKNIRTCSDCSDCSREDNLIAIA